MMHTRIRDILRRKDEDVYSVGPLATVIDAVNTMNDHHVGSVLVCEGGYPVGIFSERDVLVRVVAAHRDPRQTLVRDVMTPYVDVVACDANGTVEGLLEKARASGHRRIPLFESSIDNKHIAWMNMGIKHRLARYADKKCCGWVGDEKLIEIKRIIHVPFCWRGKSCSHFADT